MRRKVQRYGVKQGRRNVKEARKALTLTLYPYHKDEKKNGEKKIQVMDKKYHGFAIMSKWSKLNMLKFLGGLQLNEYIALYTVIRKTYIYKVASLM